MTNTSDGGPELNGIALHYFEPDLPVSQEDVLERARDLLGPLEWTGGCKPCEELRQDWLAVAWDEKLTARQAVTALNDNASRARHLAPGGGFEIETCDYGLALLQEAVAVGVAGVPWILRGGPAHKPGAEHPDNCESCARWLSNRAEARALLRAAGLDDNALLGPTDEPSWWKGPLKV